MKKQQFAAIIMLILCGCGNGSNDDMSAKSGEFAGVWDAKYNITFDSCGFLPEGQTGFEDLQNVTQNATVFTLRSSIFSPVPDQEKTLNGEIDQDFKAHFESDSTEDFFGDGIPCNVNLKISYQPTDDNLVSSLIFQSVSCLDGYACETRAVGGSNRQ